MRNFAYIEAKSWFEAKIQTALKNKKISILTILILISGCFFYNQLLSLFPRCFANNYQIEGYLEHEKEWMQKIDYIEALDKREKETKEDIYLEDSNIFVKSVESKNAEKIDFGRQLTELVGNSPIKEMVPAIVKQDYRVAAFLIGIAKKESDWGRHAPSLSGRTCFNYWGYKGSGSRGTSMGYACFGNPEEAVSVVGKRIETLVAKNINEPRKMLVWKCGSSCAGHDPAGVQKWVSDVSLYFGKVMRIKNS